ncbi:MAG: uracil-DNA glycosylase family protein [Saprospiraceae bacterium]|nr:uracil-DNA glycosylase family protein [Saprospiraceae bacterium]MCB9342321.1 uracil-DNA glycosylase family protein [Lewinellaceae bacterium]
MQDLLSEIRRCQICRDHLPHGCRPVLQASENSKILLIGQAPGKKVHETGIPWDDTSGKTLRSWLGITDEQFFDPKILALVPMGFCYPGKGPTGDLPPRPECAETWHLRVLDGLQNIQLTILIGQYAQRYYLKDNNRKTLTETVQAWETYLPSGLLPLPHPSPLNFRWQAKNKWFGTEVLPVLRARVAGILSTTH